MEMAFCSERGIAHSVFLHWDPEDRAKQIAYMLEEATRCSMCGTQPWEWRANKRAYIATIETCSGCYAKQAVTDGSDMPPGSRAVLRPYSVSAVEEQKRIYERMKKAQRDG